MVCDGLRSISERPERCSYDVEPMSCIKTQLVMLVAWPLVSMTTYLYSEDPNNSRRPYQIVGRCFQCTVYVNVIAFARSQSSLYLYCNLQYFVQSTLRCTVGPRLDGHPRSDIFSNCIILYPYSSSTLFIQFFISINKRLFIALTLSFYSIRTHHQSQCLPLPPPTMSPRKTLLPPKHPLNPVSQRRRPEAKP